MIGVALFAAGFAPSVVASWGEVGAAALLGIVMGVLLVATQDRPLEALLPFLGAFVITILGITTLSGLAGSTGVTLIVLPALFITVPATPSRRLLLSSWECGSRPGLLGWYSRCSRSV